MYTSFFEPLLKSKFGERRNEVSAAWLISRIAIRSDRGVSGERLGYLNGGFHQLITALEKSMEQKGGTIEKQAPAVSLSRDGSGWILNNTRFDAVISTIPPQELEKIGGPAACLTFLTKGRPVLPLQWNAR